MLSQRSSQFATYLHQIARLSLSLLLLLSILGFDVHNVFASTVVGGPIISDTTWTLAGSPYIVTNSVEVLAGIKLTIQPGVVVKFNSGKFLLVDGTMIAQGTPVSSIIFTSNQPSPQPGDWANIKFVDSSVDATFDSGGNYVSGSILQYCIVEYGGTTSSIGGPDTSAIYTNNASPFVDHCSVRNNYNAGIYGIGTVSQPITISNNTVSGNKGNYYNSYAGGIGASYGVVKGNNVTSNQGWGILASHSAVTGDSVVDNYGGISVSSNSTATSNYTGYNYYYGGITADSSTVTSNTVANNSQSGTGGGILAYGGMVVGNIVDNNTAGAGGGIYAQFGTSVLSNTVTNNVALNGTVGSYGGGGIRAEDNCIVSGNIIASNLSNSVAGGLFARLSTVTNNIIVDNKIAGTGNSNGSGVWFYGSNDFLRNTVVGNTTVSPASTAGGIILNSPTQFHYNTVYGNAHYDVVVGTSSDISGTNNYWGTNINVDILAHVYDFYDDGSRGRLLYIPYLQDPDPNAPVPPPKNLRATLSGNTITLIWDAIPSTTTGYGYKVYYKTGVSGPPYNGTGLVQGSSPIDVGNTTNYTLSGLGSTVYYIAVAAYDTQGHVSWYSNEVNTLRKIYLPLIRK